MVAPALAGTSSPARNLIERDIAHSVKLHFPPGPIDTYPSIQQLSPSDSTLAPHRIGCWSNAAIHGLAFDPSTECAYGDIHAKKIVLLTGDSIAGMWLPTLNAIGKSKHWRVVFLGMRSCAPWGSPNDPTFIMYGTITARECTKFSASVAKWALRTRPAAIFLAGRAYPKGRDLDKTPAIGPFKVALGHTMKTLRPSGAKLFVIGPTPRYAYGSAGIEAKDCITGTRPFKACLLPPSKVIPQTELEVEKYYDSVGKIDLVDVQSLFCTSNACSVVVQDGKKYRLVFFDSVHINRFYATWIAKAVGEAIGAL